MENVAERWDIVFYKILKNKTGFIIFSYYIDGIIYTDQRI